MSDNTIWLYILSAAIAFISVLLKIIYDKMQSDVNKKADEKRVDMMEARINNDITYSKEHHQKLLDKSEARVDREMTAMENRLTDKILRSETNILTHLNMMLDILKDERRRND